MQKAKRVVGLLTLLFCASTLAQNSDPLARKIIVSLQTGAPEAPLNAKTDRTEPSPVAKSLSGNELVAVTVVAVEPLNDRVPRQRRIDYSEDQVVIVGLAADSTELTRSVMTDPRLIRAEAIRGEQDLESTRLFRQSVDFSVAVDDPDVTSIRILKPRWTGSEWAFDMIAETPLR